MHVGSSFHAIAVALRGSIRKCRKALSAASCPAPYRSSLLDLEILLQERSYDLIPPVRPPQACREACPRVMPLNPTILRFAEPVERLPSAGTLLVIPPKREYACGHPLREG